MKLFARKWLRNIQQLCYSRDMSKTVNAENTGNGNRELTFPEAQELARSIQELTLLVSKKIVEKGDDEKRAALSRKITLALQLHASEFLMAWFAVETEYKPLLQTVGQIAERIRGFMLLTAAATSVKNAGMQQSTEPSATPPETSPANVIPLPAQ